MPEEKRKDFLIQTTKETIHQYGQEFYREYGEPKIESFKVTEGENKGRKAYTVTFFYDKEKEQMNLDYAAKVFIWEDTGKAYSIHFGNTMGKNIELLEKHGK